MAEIQLTRIKSLYGEAKGLLQHLPELSAGTGPYVVPFETIKSYNGLIDELEKVTGTLYSRQRIVENRDGNYSVHEVKPVFGSLVVRLEEQYGFSSTGAKQPQVLIVNKNEGNFNFQVNYTFNELINQANSEEEKEHLGVIRDELGRNPGSWEKIKTSLGWLMSNAWEAFLKVLPFILEHYQGHS